jgi:N-acyl-D-aspartate/D-glutamate deacylase
MGYLITNGKVLDGTGRPPFAGAVRVEGNRIAEVIAGPADAWAKMRGFLDRHLRGRAAR